MGAEAEQGGLPTISTFSGMGRSREDGVLDHRVATGGQKGERAKRYSAPNQIKG